jgi:hypothetical protein
MPPAGDPVPSPHVTPGRCNTKDKGCKSATYPYVCIDQDGEAPGDPGEVTTIHKLLKGTYENWLYLEWDTPKDGLKVTLRNENGGVVREWSSPGNPNHNIFLNCHVFDVDGATGAVTSFDQTSDNGLPIGPHDPTTPVCSTPMTTSLVLSASGGRTREGPGMPGPSP